MPSVLGSIAGDCRPFYFPLISPQKHLYPNVRQEFYAVEVGTSLYCLFPGEDDYSVVAINICSCCERLSTALTTCTFPQHLPQ